MTLRVILRLGGLPLPQGPGVSAGQAAQGLRAGAAPWSLVGGGLGGEGHYLSGPEVRVSSQRILFLSFKIREFFLLSFGLAWDP